MSDSAPHRNRRRAHGDRGMTLPEVMISVTVLALIVTVLSSAIIVTLRQEQSTEGRLNVARSEQQIGMWLPGDLASAAAVSTDPTATPCGSREVDGEFVPTGQSCPSLGLEPGTNALLIGWSMTDAFGNVTYTNVAYHFAPASNGDGFELTRIECIDSGGGWVCTTMRVLSDLPGPPPGSSWVAGGNVKPDWVIQVSEPLAANSIDEADILIGDENIKNARRVVVTVNGGGSGDGAGGGSNQISITAGGTYRNEIEGTSIQGAPSFAEARSLCGGPMTLLVDESNSIGRSGSGGSATYVTNVKNGVREFVTALAGTPVQLQVVGFHTYSHALGSSDWHKYYNMTNEADVAALLASIDTLRFDWSTAGGANGGTNWEEGLFRALRAPDGTTPAIVPETLVFFTDGVPTFDRLVHLTSPGTLPAQPPDPGEPWPNSNGSVYSQVAFDRANFVATQARASVKLIGVAVGNATTLSSNWVSNPGAGYRDIWERAYRQYRRMDFQSTIDFEVANSYQSNVDFESGEFESNRDYETRVDFETRPNSSSGYSDASLSQYLAASGTNRRIRTGNRSWSEVTAEQYWQYRGTLGTSDRWRDNGTRSWYSVAATTYDARNTNSTESDGWRISWTDVAPATYYADQPASPSTHRINGTRSWYDVTEAEYTARNTTADEADGWRLGFTDTTPANYFTNQPTTPERYRMNGSRSAYSVTGAEYSANNTTPDNSDGWQVNTASWTWVSKGDYDANNTVAGDSDGWHDMGAPEYVNSWDALDWVVWTSSRSGIDTNQFRSTRSYTQPYSAYEPATTTSVRNDELIGRLIAGGTNYVPAVFEGGAYTNVKTATLYSTTNWSQLPTALKSIALGECGGTLTLQTRLNGVPASDPFTYQNSRQISAAGADLVIEKKVVRTNRQFTTGTFDFDIRDGLYYDVVVLPENLSDLVGYQPAGWTCRAGLTNRAPEIIDIPGAETSVWKGVKIRVGANEAVSCIQAVTR